MSKLLSSFPRAFWVLMVLFFINRIGAALIWPFISVFVRDQTGAPLSQIAAMLSIQSAASLLGTSFISALMDRFGRKRAMLIGSGAYGVVLIAMSQATTLWQWALLIAVYGITQPVFYIGTNAMTADLVEPDKRTDAYAIVRTVSNISIAIAPVIGGVLIAQSRLYAYFGTAAINFLLTIPVIFFVQETLARRTSDDQPTGAGFGAIIRDTRFLAFCVVFGLLEIGIALVFTLLAVYIKENYGLIESEYGLLVSINATMVVLLQFGMTRLTKRYPPFVVLSIGALFYMAGLLGLGLSSQMAHFALAMVIVTIGELMVMPTGTAQVANMAPPDMRARYMGIFTLLFMVGAGIGPLVGGVLSDTFAPSAIWYGAATAALLAAVGFVLMPRLWQKKKAVEVEMVEV